MYLTLGQLVKYFFAFVCTKFTFMVILTNLIHIYNNEKDFMHHGCLPLHHEYQRTDHALRGT